MNAGSPAVYLLWALLSCCFLIFMLSHLWAYDRFKCLRWSSGRQPGAFKRVMTYSYVMTLPLLCIFSVVLTVIKYKEGFIVLEDGKIVPRPILLWSAANQRWILALFFILSIAWALELVTHLEELTFWLFLLHQGPGKRDWFESWEFRVWYLGSMFAILGMPLIALIKRNDKASGIAWIFMCGSAAGALTTICFFYVLARFPHFIRQVKAEGADVEVVNRLSSYYKLNVIRIKFRLLFHFPLLIIGVDGIAPPFPVLDIIFWDDFLLMLAGVGCFISSALTLLLFFPRSLHSEPKSSPPASRRSQSSASPQYHARDQASKSPSEIHLPEQYGFHSFQFPSPAVVNTLPAHPERYQMPRPNSYSDARSTSTVGDSEEFEEDGPYDISRQSSITGNARIQQLMPSERSPQSPRRPAHRVSYGQTSTNSVHPYIMNFTSPIDLPDEHDLPRAI
ncbi:hypothetical protein CYLTODRAFT_212928 [Cylindrobasidium torrendii FP15055 ss-10]|uniref:Uncharacterized protein n=1 Tax=Cylindrobasidium torrendii FP15055 ss-10 TaxID=1314674 RepID=A0A0D7BH47_9AGAR|nr:hypothetical protein CYLTODRAFT_212928 [Cylindrobasidium torrendii FP15055 ss-10]